MKLKLAGHKYVRSFLLLMIILAFIAGVSFVCKSKVDADSPFQKRQFDGMARFNIPASFFPDGIAREGEAECRGSATAGYLLDSNSTTEWILRISPLDYATARNENFSVNSYKLEPHGTVIKATTRFENYVFTGTNLTEDNGHGDHLNWHASNQTVIFLAEGTLKVDVTLDCYFTTTTGEIVNNIKEWRDVEISGVYVNSEASLQQQRSERVLSDFNWGMFFIAIGAVLITVYKMRHKIVKRRRTETSDVGDQRNIAKISHLEKG